MMTEMWTHKQTVRQGEAVLLSFCVGYFLGCQGAPITWFGLCRCGYFRMLWLPSCVLRGGDLTGGQQALGGASQRRSPQSPKSPMEGESPPSWTRLQKLHAKNEEVPGRARHAWAAAGLGDGAGGHTAPAWLPPAKPCPAPLPRGTVQSSHLLSSSTHWEFPLINLILQFCVFWVYALILLSFFFSLSPPFFFFPGKTYPVIIWKAVKASGEFFLRCYDLGLKLLNCCFLYFSFSVP